MEQVNNIPRKSNLKAYSTIAKATESSQLLPQPPILKLVRVNEFTNNRLTLLEHQAYLVVPFCLISYTVIQVLMGYNTFCQSGGIIKEWTRQINFGALSCLFINGLLQIVHIISELIFPDLNNLEKSKTLIKIHATLATISFISASSQFLTFSMNYGGMCRDALGVYSPAAQWAECALNWLDIDGTISAYIIASFVGKLVFSSYVLQWYTVFQDEYSMIKEEVIDMA
eukprot:gene15720-21279_t